MAKGTVKWFDPKKGFGFVVNDDGQDVFVHYTSIENDGFRCLRNGQVVEYHQLLADTGFSFYKYADIRRSHSGGDMKDGLHNMGFAQNTAKCEIV